MNTGFTGPTNHAKARMLAFLGQNAHFQLSAHHSVFILSTTLPRLNSSSVHLLGLSILNILQCYYLSFSLCVCVIFKDISIDKRSNILLFSGGYQSIIGGKSRGSMLSSAMAASNLWLRDAPFISEDIAYFVQDTFSTKRIFTFLWSALFNFLISTISFFFSSIERDGV